MPFCGSCGTELTGDGSFCPKCGNAINSQQPIAVDTVPTNRNVTMKTETNDYVPNHLVKAILVTIFCCWPLGIFSIINAAKVDNLLAQGDINGALEASDKANKFANWGMISIGVLLAIYFIAIILITSSAVFLKAA